MKRKLYIFTIMMALVAGLPGAAGAPADAEQLRLLRPPFAAGPVTVYATFNLVDITDIDDESESFTFSGMLSLRWKDPRLAFDPAEFGASEKVFTGEFQFREIMTAWYPEVVLLNSSGMFDKQGVVWRVGSDGECVLIQMINATAEAELDLRRYPYDGQSLVAIFKVLGFVDDKVVLAADPAHESSFNPNMRIPQWRFNGMTAANVDVKIPRASTGSFISASTFAITAEVHRERWFIVRLLVIPLIIIVVLSWSVFWMDSSSLGDRMSVSFVAILAAVTYQIFIGDILPKISYFTPMHGFLGVSFVVTCLTVLINLLVGSCDKAGKTKLGNRLDRHSRWAFPLAYLVILAMIATFALL